MCAEGDGRVHSIKLGEIGWLSSREIHHFILKRVARVVQGWINYYGISDNDRRVRGFIMAAKHTLLKWFRRRGGRKKTSWYRFNLLLKQAGFPERWKIKSMFPNPNVEKA